jgi:hypothetical protein
MKKIVLFALVAVMVCVFSVSLATGLEEAEKEGQKEVVISPERGGAQTDVEPADEEYKKPAKAVTPAVPVAQPTLTDLTKKFTGIDENSVTNVGPVKKGASLNFTPGSLANYYLFLFVNGEWVAYKIPDGATSINIPVDSSAAFIAGSNTPLAGTNSL